METHPRRVIDSEIVNLDGSLFGDAPVLREAASVPPEAPEPPARPAPRVMHRSAMPLSTFLAGTFLGVAFGALVVMATATAQPERAPDELGKWGPAVKAVTATIAAPADNEVRLDEVIVRGSLSGAVPADAVTTGRAPLAAPVKAIARRDAEAPAAARDALPASPTRAAIDASDEAPRGINTAAASTAISIAAARAGRCVAADDARTTMGVRVTFAPSGRVTTAVVSSGPFAGTDIGGCIARALRSATVAAFDGPAVTVRRSVTVR